MQYPTPPTTYSPTNPPTSTHPRRVPSTMPSPASHLPVAPPPPCPALPRLPSPVVESLSTANAGGPYGITAGESATLNGSNSTCVVAPCTYAWTVSCPSRPDVIRGGAITTVTTGPSNSFDINTYGLTGPLPCTVNLAITGERSGGFGWWFGCAPHLMHVIIRPSPERLSTVKLESNFGQMLLCLSQAVLKRKTNKGMHRCAGQTLVKSW